MKAAQAHLNTKEPQMTSGYGQFAGQWGANAQLAAKRNTLAARAIIEGLK